VPRWRRMRDNNVADALVLTSPRSFERRPFALPETGPDDGILRVEACGLCGTDHEEYTGELSPPFGFIPGHEVVGVVTRLGERAARRWGVQEGDRVAVEVFLSCRECEPCREGTYRRCRRNGLSTMIGYVDVNRPPFLWGGYATHLYLAPDSMLLPVPPGLDPVLATMFNPLGAGIRWGATVPETKPGDVVAVLGPGVRGLSACVAAKEAGAEFVMLTGVRPRDDARLDVAHRFGADLVVDVARDRPATVLKRELGRLADIVVDVTAKAPAALAQAVTLARPGGTIVLAGTRGPVEAPGFYPDHVVSKELRIIGALGVDYPAYAEALRILDSGRYPFAELPRRVATLDTLESLVRTMAGEGDVDIPVHGVVTP
jgi:alcohol dehydrogenase